MARSTVKKVTTPRKRDFLDKIIEELIADGHYDAFGDPWMTVHRAVGSPDLKQSDRDNPCAPWFRAIDYIYRLEEDKPFRDLIKAGVKVPEEMHPHIDELFERVLFPPSKRTKRPVKSRRGPKGTPSLWKMSYTAWRLESALEEAAEAAKRENITKTEYLEKMLKNDLSEYERTFINQQISVLEGKHGPTNRRKHKNR